MIFKADARHLPSEILPESVQCVVTSPPYFGLRNYETGHWVGGESEHDHKGSERYYTEKTAAVSSVDAFVAPGEANAARIKAGRWREAGTCSCAAVWVDLQIGLERTPEQYISELVDAFREVHRVMRSDGTLWIVIGDSYCGYHGNAQVPDEAAPSNKPGFIENMRASTIGMGGLKNKDLIGLPWMLAFALRANGWYLRSDIIWHKPNPMPPGGITDRPTSSYEHVFLFSKSERYYFDLISIREHAVSNHSAGQGYVRPERLHFGDRGSGTIWNDVGGWRNNRDVWSIPVKTSGLRLCRTCQRVYERKKKCERCGTKLTGHYAAFPPNLVRPCVLAGSRPEDLVFDPFLGTGTVAAVAMDLGRHWVGTEISDDYIALAKYRTDPISLDREFT